MEKFMKNKWKPGAFLAALLVCLCLAGAAWAATPIALSVDGVVVVPTELSVVREQYGDEVRAIEGFYQEAPPEMRRGTVYVPVRFVAEVLGAEVVYAAPNVEINCGGRRVRLACGSKTAYVDGGAVKLAGAPYEKAGRTYVPVRFVAEALDCEIDYENGLVNIRTKPWELNGREVCGIQKEGYMTIGGYLWQLDSPYFAKRIYEALWQNKGAQVAAPAEDHLGRWPSLEKPDFFYIGSNYYLLDAHGDIVAQFDLWKYDDGTYPVSEVYDGDLLCCDGQWFNFSEASRRALGQWSQIYFWGQEIDDSRAGWERRRQNGLLD